MHTLIICIIQSTDSNGDSDSNKLMSQLPSCGKTVCVKGEACDQVAHRSIKMIKAVIINPAHPLSRVTQHLLSVFVNEKKITETFIRMLRINRSIFKFDGATRQKNLIIYILQKVKKWFSYFV